MRIIEVGPRDGLQNEPVTIPTSVKVAYVNALAQTGLRDIEVSAFVSPKWVPQLADAEDVFRGIQREPGVTYSALVPNARGLERALSVDVPKIAVFTAASETFSQKNVNTSIAGTFERFEPVLARAEARSVAVRGYVSTAFVCPYEGPIAPEKVCDVVQGLVDLGIDEISLGDTIGKATPDDVARLLELLLARFQPELFAMHFHDTYGHAVENVRCAVSRGISRFDASAGGIGGCPYAPGAAGNVSTDKVARVLEELGYPLGIDLDALARAARLVQQYVGFRRPLAEAKH